jgi:5-carboxymethyl-2-hydroxymuconic-semialdehyde dehydrogenase
MTVPAHRFQAGTPAIRIGEATISPLHYIGGARRGSDRRFEVFSPIDMRVLGEVCLAGPDEVSAAVAAAQAAFPSWAALGATGRLPYLQRFAEQLGHRAEALCLTESNDAGVLLSRMRHGVVPRCRQNITYFAEAALSLQDSALETAQAHHAIRHDPAGVCAIITPWNAPLMLATWKIGPALASGNTVVVKPAEWAPLSCSLLADAAHDAGLPPGVLNIVQGTGAETGAALVADPRVRRISFTGSVPTARSVAAAAAANLTPVSLELGGKSPFIVLEDADLDNAAATGALMYRNATQVCLAGTRFLVHARIRDAFLDRMRAIVERLVIGDPREETTEVGPIIHPRQFARISEFVDRARTDGAHALWGGAPHATGPLYYQPTMLAAMAEDAEIVREEVFGPVLTVQSFSDDAEAIRLANDTAYGLGGVCFGDAPHAKAIAEQVRTGFIWVNSFGLRDLAAPFGGCRNSGIGREGGDWSFDFFCDVKDVIAPKQPFRPAFNLR